MSKWFMLVGSWHYRPSPRGLTIFDWASDQATQILHCFEDASIGSMTIDAARHAVFFCDERGNLRGRIGGGGYVLSVCIDPVSGNPVPLSEQMSLSSEPSGLLLSPSGERLIVVHHCDGGHVTRVSRGADGRWTNTVLFDDAAIVLFPVAADGRIGDPLDVILPSSDGDRHPQLHHIAANPSGEIYAVCDKGTDSVRSFQLAPDGNRLLSIGAWQADPGSAPRYGVFHPTLPLYYCNCERMPAIYVLKYGAHGLLSHFRTVRFPEVDRQMEPSDILLSPDGRSLYLSIRGTNQIAFFSVDESGVPTFHQSTHCSGINPRGLCLSPSGDALLVANSDSDCIAVFPIAEDGSLRECNQRIPCLCPACIRFMQR